MSESLRKLKEIPVVNKILSELDRALDVKDKVLAEFILDIAKKSPTVSVFEKSLDEMEAGFSIELINNIYSIVTRMLPEYFKKENERKAAEEERGTDGHFKKTKMLEDEPEKPLYAARTEKKGTEEDKFD